MKIQTVGTARGSPSTSLNMVSTGAVKQSTETSFTASGATAG